MRWRKKGSFAETDDESITTTTTNTTNTTTTTTEGVVSLLWRKPLEGDIRWKRDTVAHSGNGNPNQNRLIVEVLSVSSSATSGSQIGLSCSRNSIKQPTSSSKTFPKLNQSCLFSKINFSLLTNFRVFNSQLWTAFIQLEIEVTIKIFFKCWIMSLLYKELFSPNGDKGEEEENI